MVAEEVLVEEQLAVDDGGGGVEDGEDGVEEDGGLAEVVGLVGPEVGELGGGGGLDGLVTLDVSSTPLIRHVVGSEGRLPRPARCS